MHLNDHVAEYAAKLEGNWRKFESFGWYDRPGDAERWCIVYTHNRDSGCLARSNAEYIARALEPFKDDVSAEHHGHWAVGWVDGYAVRVRDEHGNYTEAFRAWVGIALTLEDYPSLDDSRLSDLEWEEACETWRCMSIRSRVEAWLACRGSFHLMACRRDEMPHDDNGALLEYLVQS